MLLPRYVVYGMPSLTRCSHRVDVSAIPHPWSLANLRAKYSYGPLVLVVIRGEMHVIQVEE